MAKKLEELARQEEREYKKAWRAKNKDRVRQYNADYWKRRVEKRLQEQKEAAK